MFLRLVITPLAPLATKFNTETELITHHSTNGPNSTTPGWFHNEQCEIKSSKLNINDVKIIQLNRCFTAEFISTNCELREYIAVAMQFYCWLQMLLEMRNCLYIIAYAYKLYESCEAGIEHVYNRIRLIC